MPFFGVNIGALGAEECEWPADIPRVCSDMPQLQVVLRKIRSARFKQFETYGEAEAFSRRLMTSVGSGVGGGGGGDRSPTPAERPSPYSTPSRPECQQLRAAIQCGDTGAVELMLQNNLRLLISSGDTPTVLREGPRENALHQAALHDQPSICRLLLNTVADVRTFLSLYPDDSDEVAAVRAQRALDLYLNMPTKVSLETPLHMAAKRGYAAIVEVLAGYDVCQRDAVNRHGETPVQVVCEQFKGEGDVNEVRRRIKQLLQQPYYVPVVVDVNGCSLGYVARPCSFQQLQCLDLARVTPPRLSIGVNAVGCAGEGRPDLDLSPVRASPVVASYADNSCVSSSVLTPCRVASEARVGDASPLVGSGVWAARSWAGPMSLPQAEQFYRRWRCLGTSTAAAATPSSNSGPSSGPPCPSVTVSGRLSASSSPARCPPDPVARHVRASDPDKGLERIGRALAAELHVPWSEYWPCLRRHADLRSEAGLRALEQHLCRQSMRLLRVESGCDRCSDGDSLPWLSLTGGVTSLLKSVSQRLNTGLNQSVKRDDCDEFDVKVSNNNNNNNGCHFDLSPISALCSQMDRMSLVTSRNERLSVGSSDDNPISSPPLNVWNSALSESSRLSLTSPLISPDKAGWQAPPATPNTSLSHAADERLSEDPSDEHEGFFTPTASLSGSPIEVATPPEPPPVFIDGTVLSRADFDVYRALCREQCAGNSPGEVANSQSENSENSACEKLGPVVDLNVEHYPCIVQWMSHVEHALVGDVLAAGETTTLGAENGGTPSAVARAILLATPTRNRSGLGDLSSPLSGVVSPLSRSRLTLANNSVQSPECGRTPVGRHGPSTPGDSRGSPKLRRYPLNASGGRF